MHLKKILFFIAGFCMLFLLACGPRAIALRAGLDTPEQHVDTGNKMLMNGKIDAAYREFSRAKELDPKYSPAYVGLSLVYGLKDDNENSSIYIKKAIDTLRKTIPK
jgi:Tfp pilus assembly protein PilF